MQFGRWGDLLLQASFDLNLKIHWISSRLVCTHLNASFFFFFFFFELNSNMWATPTKQGTNDILGKMSFWYHCKEHTFSFNLIKFILLLIFKIWPYVYTTLSGFSGRHIKKKSQDQVEVEVWFWEISLPRSSWSWSVILRNRPSEFPFPVVFGFDRLQKMQIFFFFLLKNVWKSVINYMEVTEDILR